MALYWSCISLHLLTAVLWLGHMFVWSLVVGPAMKRIEPPQTAELLREYSVFMGGLGWPALAVLIVTGLYMLSWRGVSPSSLLSGAAFSVAGGILVKLAPVLFMIFYKWFSATAGPRAPSPSTSLRR